MRDSRNTRGNRLTSRPSTNGFDLSKHTGPIPPLAPDKVQLVVQGVTLVAAAAGFLWNAVNESYQLFKKMTDEK